MKLNELRPAEGSTRESFRVGRGPGSGNGKTAGKGHKGQNARSGGGVRPGFEGGQMPLQRRIPKRGFNNIFAKEIVAINLNALNAFEDGAVVNAETLLANGVVKKLFDGVKVLDNVSFIVNRDDKIAFVGIEHNSITALFDILNGVKKADSGDYYWGQTTSQTYLPRDNAEYFNNDYNITEWLKQYSKDQDDAYVRGFLGRMLFTGDESLKKVKILSGGEKVRCMLSKLMLSGANVLTMDDPTNHLDLEAIQSLNEGLIAFGGVVLFTSHDHEFIQSIANRIIEITPNGVIDRMMSFDDYIKDEQVTELRKQMYEGTGKKIKYRV